MTDLFTTSPMRGTLSTRSAFFLRVLGGSVVNSRDHPALWRIRWRIVAGACPGKDWPICRLGRHKGVSGAQRLLVLVILAVNAKRYSLQSCYLSGLCVERSAASNTDDSDEMPFGIEDDSG